MNGGYPVWQHAISAVTERVPFSVGDVVKAAFIVFAIYIVLDGWRNSLRVRISRGPARKLNARIRRHVRVFFITIARLLALAGFAVVWFEFGWGFNYDRAPVETRLQYHASAVTPAALDALRARAMREINTLSWRAHVTRKFDIADLRDTWLPVIARFGDAWTPNVGEPKPTITDPLLVATGTSGFVSPFTLEVQTASDLLWFERPFDLAHEWTHVAGFAKEDEANYAAALACTRSKDPVIAYSGWLGIFLTVPPLRRYERKMFAPQVWQDFYALRDQRARQINRSLARLMSRAYDAYLKGNHIANGVKNYDEVTRLLLAIPLDKDGLPLPKKSQGVPKEIFL